MNRGIVILATRVLFNLDSQVHRHDEIVFPTNLADIVKQAKHEFALRGLPNSSDMYVSTFNLELPNSGSFLKRVLEFFPLSALNEFSSWCDENIHDLDNGETFENLLEACEGKLEWAKYLYENNLFCYYRVDLHADLGRMVFDNNSNLQKLRDDYEEIYYFIDWEGYGESLGYVRTCNGFVDLY